jgi:hypothetical protein
MHDWRYLVEPVGLFEKGELAGRDSRSTRNQARPGLEGAQILSTH